MGLAAWLNAARFGLRRGRREKPPPLPPGTVPFHIAIIMDGNGRWAARRHLPSMAGHRAGTQALKRTVKAAVARGIRQLTVFTFSTENWTRPEDEVQGLMALLAESIDNEVAELDEQGVEVVFIGEWESLAPSLQERMRRAQERTQGNDRMTLFVALNYGGRNEILDAVNRALADGVESGALAETDIARHLYAPQMREPDLIIRTSGERRLSNFLLWQSAYSEFYFSDVLWPDFGEEHLDTALHDYATRDRRFGGRREGGRA